MSRFDEALCGRIDSQLKALHLPGALARYRSLAEELDLDDRALALLDGILATLAPFSIDTRSVPRHLPGVGPPPSASSSRCLSTKRERNSVKDRERLQHIRSRYQLPESPCQ